MTDVTQATEGTAPPSPSLLRLLRLFWLSLQPGRDQLLRRAPDIVSAMLGGVVAAGLGLGVFAVLVLFMWITSPYADSGPNGALHIAAALWLLAHGADLLRTDALTGATVPVGVTPLLLTALPAWLVYRAAGHAVDAAEDARLAAAVDEVEVVGSYGPAGKPGSSERPGVARSDGPLGPVAVAGSLVAGYLLVALFAVVYTLHGSLRSSPLSALLFVPLMVVCAAAAGVGAPRLRLPMTREAVDDVLGGALGVAIRGAIVGVAVLVAGGALLTAGAMVWHGLASGQSLVQLTRSVSGRFAVLLLAAALMPNAAVWGASYALGTGFAVGVGSAVAPAGVHGYPAVLPDFPLLTALPGPTGHPATPLEWLVLAVPFASSVAVAWYVADRADLYRWSVGRAAAVAGLAAVACGTAMALAATFSAGPMGDGALADFGPVGWRSGVAALGWTALVAVPGAAGASLWRLRGPRPGPPRRMPAQQTGRRAKADIRAKADAEAKVTAEATAPAPAPEKAAVGSGPTPGEVRPQWWEEVFEGPDQDPALGAPDSSEPSDREDRESRAGAVSPDGPDGTEIPRSPQKPVGPPGPPDAHS